MAQKKRRPFHETIVDAIDNANSSNEMFCLANLIKATEIPEGHGKIIAAWKKQMQEIYIGDDDLGVPADLLEQKKAAAKKKTKK